MENLVDRNKTDIDNLTDRMIDRRRQFNRQKYKHT